METKVCPVCGEKFVAKRESRIYCSHQCRALASFRRSYRQKERPCKACGKIFKTSKKYQKYCSDECKVKAHVKVENTAPKRQGEKEICAYCGKEFIVSLENKKYCSDQCRFLAKTGFRRRSMRNTALRKRLLRNVAAIPLKCEFCGKDFFYFYSPYQRIPKYCSETCRKAMALLKNLYQYVEKRGYIQYILWILLISPKQQVLGKTLPEMLEMLKLAKDRIHERIKRGDVEVFIENCSIRGDYTWALDENEVKEVINAPTFEEAIKIVQRKCKETLERMRQSSGQYAQKWTSYIQHLPERIRQREEEIKQKTCQHPKRQRKIISIDGKLYDAIYCVECKAVIDKAPIFG